MKNKIKYALLGLGSSIAFFVVFGGITAIIPSQFYIRMIPTTLLDKIFLASSSALLGAYVGVHYYKKKIVKQCNAVATTGGIGSFLAFSCPICNKILVLLFGAASLMTYFEPYRPVLGIVSSGLLGAAVYWRIKT